jgi:hypothetical protein
MNNKPRNRPRRPPWHKYGHRRIRADGMWSCEYRDFGPHLSIWIIWHDISGGRGEEEYAGQCTTLKQAKDFVQEKDPYRWPSL